jgi:hypothetical protein
MTSATAPLYRDPIYDGAADPAIIFNRQEKVWCILYTNRRANVAGPGLAWVHGTDIGIAASSDGGHTWLYRGIAEGLKYKPGRNTYWAPEVIYFEGLYHMYVSFILGVPSDWSGERQILHYTSRNIYDWQYHSTLALSSSYVIDACVERIPSGKWRMWFKDEKHNSYIYSADSVDLYRWEDHGPVISDRGQEGPFVFQWRNYYWMITDVWDGLAVFRSKDAENWTKQALHILQQPGIRTDDGAKGGHASVIVQGEDAYIVYFTHPDEGKPRTSLQTARLYLSNGEIHCDRDQPFDFNLKSELAPMIRGGDA